MSSINAGQWPTLLSIITVKVYRMWLEYIWCKKRPWIGHFKIEKVGLFTSAKNQLDNNLTTYMPLLETDTTIWKKTISNANQKSNICQD